MPLEVLWGSGGRQFFEGFCQTQVLPNSRSAERLKELGLDSCYTDPTVRKAKHYAKFLRRLEKVGVVTDNFLIGVVQLRPK